MIYSINHATKVGILSAALLWQRPVDPPLDDPSEPTGELVDPNKPPRPPPVDPPQPSPPRPHGPHSPQPDDVPWIPYTGPFYTRGEISATATVADVTPFRDFAHHFRMT